MSLDCLPPEILLSVMSYLDCPKDRSAFTRTSRRYHCSLNRELFILSIVELDFWGIFWAARTGNLPTLKGFLDAAKPAFHMAPIGSDLEWRPVWEFWPSWGARFQGNLFQRIPVFNYRGHSWYNGNTHIPIFCLYREALVEAAMHGQVKTFQLLAAQIPWHLHEIDYYESDDGGRWYALSHLAAFYNKPAIMELLVNDGVNLMAGFPERVPEDTPLPPHRGGFVIVVLIRVLTCLPSPAQASALDRGPPRRRGSSYGAAGLAPVDVGAAYGPDHRARQEGHVYRCQLMTLTYSL